MPYIVKGLMAIVNLLDGTAAHLQHGAAVPSNVTPDHLQHLLDQDLVEEADAVGGLAPVYSGDLTKQVTGAVPADLGAVDEVDDVDGPDGPIPPKSATKDVWVDYATSVETAAGKDATAARADAEALTKDQLIEQYGGA